MVEAHRLMLANKRCWVSMENHTARNDVLRLGCEFLKEKKQSLIVLSHNTHPAFVSLPPPLFNGLYGGLFCVVIGPGLVWISFHDTLSLSLRSII